tara:strand:- start:293 stop:652 length:360 start_codon:yes stop_codon:yes gene_type:complete
MVKSQIKKESIQEYENFLKDRKLRMATELAVKERRSQLADLERKICYSDILEEWVHASNITTSQARELAEIKKEKMIIENLMIRTNKFYEKLGGKTEYVIQRSDRSTPEATYTLEGKLK